jgi:hypothetical protein
VMEGAMQQAPQPERQSIEMITPGFSWATAAR